MNMKLESEFVYTKQAGSYRNNHNKKEMKLDTQFWPPLLNGFTKSCMLHIVGSSFFFL